MDYTIPLNDATFCVPFIDNHVYNRFSINIFFWSLLLLKRYGKQWVLLFFNRLKGMQIIENKEYKSTGSIGLLIANVQYLLKLGQSDDVQSAKYVEAFD